MASPTVMPTPECITATVVARVHRQHRERRRAVRAIHALPALQHPQPCAQRLRGQVQHGIVDGFVVERKRVLAIAMRIADDQLAMRLGLISR